MSQNDYYIYKKEVDWSLLNQGFSIPITIQVVFQKAIEKFLPRGHSKEVFLILENNTYKVKLINQKFDEKKYPNRKDILQLRYNTQSDIAEKFREIFFESYNYLSNLRNGSSENQRKYISIPEERKEYMAIYTTEYVDTYYIECITREENQTFKNIIVHEDEQNYETEVNYEIVDPTSTIVTKNQTIKIRRLNKAIGENLKLLYNYRCQLCGEKIGEKYSVNVAESHHIDPFVESLNNNADNQIILCPNHHRIIHRAKPSFYRKNLIFIYHNGSEDKVILNHHL